MSLSETDIKLRKPSEISDLPTNGGRMTYNEFPADPKNNLFENISEAERTAGSVKYRKLFLQNHNIENIGLLYPYFYLSNHTPEDDMVYLFEGTQRDTQADITGSEPLYGSGTLAVTVSSGATSIDVEVEDSSVEIFRVGDKIRITDKENEIAATGNEEKVEIDVVNAPVGNTITLDLTTALVNGYTAGGAIQTRVMSLCYISDVTTEISNFTVTSGSGTYDIGTYPIALQNQGCLEQDYVILFDSDTTFTCSGDTLGSLGTGNISTVFAPLNTDTGKSLFTLQFEGWGGVFANGDIVSFSSAPSSVPIWHKRDVPAGSNNGDANGFYSVIQGES